MACAELVWVMPPSGGAGKCKFLSSHPSPSSSQLRAGEGRASSPSSLSGVGNVESLIRRGPTGVHSQPQLRTDATLSRQGMCFREPKFMPTSGFFTWLFTGQGNHTPESAHSHGYTCKMVYEDERFRERAVEFQQRRNRTPTGGLQVCKMEGRM